MSKMEMPTARLSIVHLIVLLHAFATVCFLVVFCLWPISFELKSVKNLIISEATADGVDIGMRVSLMYKFIFGGTVAVAVFYKLFLYLAAKLNIAFRRQYELILLSASIICIAFLQVLNAPALTTLKLLEVIFWFRLATLIPFKSFDRGVLKSKTIFALLLAFAFLTLFACFFLLGSYAFVRENIVWIFSVALLLFILTFYFFCRNSYSNYKKVTTFFLPLTTIPYIAFFSLELLFYIQQSKGYFIAYKWLFLVLLGITWLLMNFLFFRKKKEIKIDKLVRNWIAPSMIVSFVLLAFYTPVLQPINEIYEYANYANSVMNVFAFGKIPFLDFMSTHMMVEQWFGYLYALIFGYNTNLDFLVYGFLNTLFFYFVLYWFLNRLFRRPLLSLFFLFFFPFIWETFYLYVFIAIIPFFFSRQLLERPTAKGFLKLFLIIAVLLLWKIDTGVCAIFATTFYFPLLYFVAKVKFPLKAFLQGLTFFVFICLVLFLVAIMFRSPAGILNNIQLALHLFSASQAHGLTNIGANYVQQFYVYHILFPVIGMMACAYILIMLRRKPMAALFTENHLLLASLFLFILYFSNIQRGLVRHSFAEQNEILLSSTFFAALALLLVHLFKARKPLLKLALFYVATFSLFILLKFFPFHTSEATLDFALNNNAISTVDATIASPNYKGRTMIDTAFANPTYRQLKTFLDNNITKEQTFLDFSNSPMLYYYCQRTVVGYFNQNLQNTVDDYLQFDLLKKMDTAKVPVVVFASYPRSWFDATDGIQNVLRYYLIAEYIFDHYKPYGVIGNKSVWLSNSFHAMPPPAKTDDLLAQPENTDLKLIPEYTGLFYNDPSNLKDLKTVRTWTEQDFNLNDDNLMLSLDTAVLGLHHCYLAVDFKPSSAYFDPFQVQVQFQDTSGSALAAFSFTRRDVVSSRYMIRLSNHYFWHQHHLLRLRIASAGAIKQISILEDTRVEY